MQTALVTGSTDRVRGPVEVRPFRFGRPADTGASPPSAAAIGPGGDVGPRPAIWRRSANAAREAFAASGASPPRRPWTDPLPGLDVADLEPDFGVASGRAGAPIDTAGPRFVPVALGLADLPDEQRQEPAWWDPAAGGLLSSASAAPAPRRRRAPPSWPWPSTSARDDLHVYVLDFGAGDHAGLAALPHVGAVVAGRATGSGSGAPWPCSAPSSTDAGPTDGAGPRPPASCSWSTGSAASGAAFDGEPPGGGLDLLGAPVADGPALGSRPPCSPPIGPVRSRRRSVGSDPPAARASGSSDRNDHGAFGIAPSAVPDLPPGRGHLAEGPTLVQVARTARPRRDDRTDPPDGIRSHRLDRQPRPIGALPSSMDLTALLDAVEAPVLADGRWHPARRRRHRRPRPARDQAPSPRPSARGRSGSLGSDERRCAPWRPWRRRTIAAVHVVAVAGPARRSLDQRRARPDRLASTSVDAGPTSRASGARRAGPRPRRRRRPDRRRRPARRPARSGPARRCTSSRPGRPSRCASASATGPGASAPAGPGCCSSPTSTSTATCSAAACPRRPPVPLGRGRGWLVNDGDARLVQVAHDERT